MQCPQTLLSEAFGKGSGCARLDVFMESHPKNKTKKKTKAMKKEVNELDVVLDADSKSHTSDFFF